MDADSVPSVLKGTLSLSLPIASTVNRPSKGQESVQAKIPPFSPGMEAARWAGGFSPRARAACCGAAVEKEGGGGSRRVAAKRETRRRKNCCGSAAGVARARMAIRGAALPRRGSRNEAAASCGHGPARLNLPSVWPPTRSSSLDIEQARMASTEVPWCAEADCQVAAAGRSAQTAMPSAWTSRPSARGSQRPARSREGLVWLLKTHFGRNTRQSWMQAG